MPEWLAVVLLGIIEGVTEFLPISSTGHLLLAENSGLLPRQSELFNIVIQAGAVLAVFLVFSRRVKTLLFGLAEPEARAYLGKLAVAFVLTIAGVLITRKLGFELPKDLWPIAWATVWGGVLILIIEWSVTERRSRTEVTWAMAIVVAVAQILAATSRVEGMPTSSGFFGAMPSCIMGRSAALVASVKSGIAAPSATA